MPVGRSPVRPRARVLARATPEAARPSPRDARPLTPTPDPVDTANNWGGTIAGGDAKRTHEMRHFIHRIGSPSHRLARRLRTARPGSVLILVVALLVLMALIGTAWLSTARVDRYGAQQNANNTQVELLLQAAISLAQAAIVDDLFAEGRYRPSEGPGIDDYEHHDYPGAVRGS